MDMDKDLTRIPVRTHSPRFQRLFEGKCLTRHVGVMPHLPRDNNGENVMKIVSLSWPTFHEGKGWLKGVAL